MLSVVQAEPSHGDYAAERLRGTVWERSGFAHFAYRSCMTVGRTFGRVGVTPNMLTIGSLLIATVAAVTASMKLFVATAVVVVLSGTLDVLDGVVARATGRVTRFGALLDSTVDRLADGLPLLGLIVAYSDHGILAVVPGIAMLGAFGISYVRARAESLGAKLPPLFMRRAERVILLTLSLLLSAVPVVAPVRAPLLLAGVALMGVLNLVATFWALRASYLALNSDGSSAALEDSMPPGDTVSALDALDVKVSAQ